jgi:sugar lactone lactonase YvrE
MSKRVRNSWVLALAALAAAGCGGDSSEDAALEVMDLDPSSAGPSMIFESITADSQGRLYLADRVNGALWQVDPATGSKSHVASIPIRQVNDAEPIRPDPGGLLFDAQGNLLIASAPFSEVLRVPAAELNPAAPGRARTFATGTQGANSLVFDRQGRLYISGGNTGNIYRVGPGGGEAEVVAKIGTFTRAVAPDGFMQSVVANGLAFDPSGTLLVADTSRGSVWKVALGSDGSAAAPEQLAASQLLEGIDGLTFDPAGTLWGAVNEQNQLVTISPEGEVTLRFKNDAAGPLEFPAAIVFTGGSGYVVNFDRARGANFAADGMTSVEGVGASIVVLPSAAAPRAASPAVASDSDRSGY